MRSEKLLIKIKFLTTMDYGHEQDDRIILSFSHTFPSPLSNAIPPSPFHSMSNDSSSVVPHPVNRRNALTAQISKRAHHAM